MEDGGETGAGYIAVRVETIPVRQAASETLAAYRDGGEILAYAREPMAWALENGILPTFVMEAMRVLWLGVIRSLPLVAQP